MKNCGKIIYIICFLLIMIIPLAFINTASGVRSELDNRYLAEFPSEGDDFVPGFETYIKDRIGFRNEMIHAYDLINDRLFNELTHPTYTYGKNGYVFFNMHNNIKYSSFHKTFAEMLLKLQQYVEARGSNFYFIFEPEKISVYRDYLPEGVNYNDEWVEQFTSYLSELGVNYVDAGVILKERSKTEMVFDKMYDAGHWNDLGEYYATNMLLQRIHQDVPEVLPLDLSMFRIEQVNAKYLKNSEFVINETIPVFDLKTNYDNVTDKWSDDIKTNPSFKYFHYFINRSAGADDLPKALVFQGSYYNRRPEFFVPAFSEFIGIHNYQNILDIEYYFNIFKPDIVILDAAEYVFTNYYFDQSRMNSLVLKPSLDTSVWWSQVLLKARIDMTEGDEIDRLKIRIPFADVTNAWLASDDQIFDMFRDSEGVYKLETSHGYLRSGAECGVYILMRTGERYYISSVIRPVKDIFSNATLSHNAEIDDGSIVFTTDVDGNSFNSVEVQLYDQTGKSYLKLINRSNNAGKVSFTYLHTNESGLYNIRVKANSNLKDEYADHPVYLEKGDQYDISFVLKDLSEKRAEVGSFRVIGPSVP